MLEKAHVIHENIFVACGIDHLVKLRDVGLDRSWSACVEEETSQIRSLLPIHLKCSHLLALEAHHTRDIRSQIVISTAVQTRTHWHYLTLSALAHR